MTVSRTVLLAALAVIAAAPAFAQNPPATRSPIVRADLHGTLGWFNADTDASGTYNDWYNRSLYGGAGFGWYWTDHLKTEIEFGSTSDAELYSSELVTFSSQRTPRFFRQRFSTKRIGVSQQYQFYRNQWFHPYLAAGVDLKWETVKRRDDPVYAYDPVTRQSRIEGATEDYAAETSLNAQPFAVAGFKAYMTQRSFFRSDIRIGVRSGVDEALLRFGFGVDF